VSITHSFRRPAQVCAIACALLAPATAASAAADPLAQERQYMSQPAAGPSQRPVAQEQYYSSYGDPEPLSAPPSPSPANETPWLPIALSAVLALAAAGVGASRFRRVRLRRSAVRTTT
jgi:hypothetical protein